jgi:hypothetical protein
MPVGSDVPRGYVHVACTYRRAKRIGPSENSTFGIVLEMQESKAPTVQPTKVRRHYDLALHVH